MTCREFVQDLLLNVPLDNEIVFRFDDDDQPDIWEIFLREYRPFESFKNNKSVINLEPYSMKNIMSLHRQTIDEASGIWGGYI